MPNIPCLSEFKAFKLAQESRVSALELSNTSGVAKYVPASGIQAGALPSGVTIGSSQVDGLTTAIQTTLASSSINTSQINNLCPAVQNCLSTATINANNITGTLPTAVLINDTSNFGAGAISTDTKSGVSRSATVAETGAGVLNNGVHTSPADLVSAINAPAVGGVFNPLQMSVRGQIPYYLFSKQTITSGTDRQEVIVDLNGKLWAGHTIYGTNLLPPTLAPNDNNSTVIPKAATVVATSSGDTYIWNGVVWVNISSSSSTATRTYKDVTPNRAELTTYINTTSAELVVIINVVGGVNVNHFILVDGMEVCSRHAATSAGFVYYGTLEAIVPVGSNYMYNSLVGSINVQGQIQKWVELSAN